MVNIQANQFRVSMRLSNEGASRELRLREVWIT